jgi:glycosyltransferase involved in cell wall biosynthesis
MEVNELSVNAMGGTELMMKRIYDSLDPKLLETVQIIPSRVRELKNDKIRILYCHDLAEDPEAEKALGNRRWERFHQIVFVSNWQMQQYIQKYDIPWSKCVVIPNAIDPVRAPAQDYSFLRTPDRPYKFIYHTTPHRGLNILCAVIDELAKKHPVHLDVYSSFKIYGWPDRDEQFRALFDEIDAHPNMTNHGSVSNDEVRNALKTADIFAYPCTWTETSCLALIEAMSAGLLCVHSNLGALFETSASWTTMYQYLENVNDHASALYQILDNALINWGSDIQQNQIKNQREYVNVFHNWNFRKHQWESLILSLQSEPREMPEPSFVYRT